MTTTQATRPIRARRPGLHVNIEDQFGRVLADVDAVSTADALAYFLTSRGIDTTATEGSILQAAALDRPNMVPPGDRETIVREPRTWDGRIDYDGQLLARVTWAEGDR